MANKKNEGLAELNGYVPKELKTEFKKACVAAERTMGDVLAELIREWLERQSKK